MVSYCARFVARQFLKPKLHYFLACESRFYSITNLTKMEEEKIYIAFPDKPAHLTKSSVSSSNQGISPSGKVSSHISKFLDCNYNTYLIFPDVEKYQHTYLMSAVSSQSLIRTLTNICPSDGGCAICTVATSTSQQLRRGVCIYFAKPTVENENSELTAKIQSMLTEQGLKKYSILEYENGNMFTKVDKLVSNSDEKYEESKFTHSPVAFTVEKTDEDICESFFFVKDSELCPVFHGYERTKLVLNQFYEDKKSPEVSELLKIADTFIPESFSCNDLRTQMKFPFIVVEGLDATGKTTITQILCEKMNGVRYYTPPGPIQHLRKYFDALPEIIRRAYYSVGNYIVAMQISKECATRSVVMDRYWHSTTAYGIANETSSGDLPSLGHWVYKWPLDLLKPDIVLFLSVSEEVRRQRLDNRALEKTFEEKSLDKDKLFRQRLYDSYRRMEDPCCIEMDASAPIQTVVNDAMNMLEKHGIKKPIASEL